MTRRLYQTRYQPYVWALLLGAALAGATLVNPFIGFGIVLGAAFAVLALTRPVVLCYALVGAVVFLSGMPRGSLIPLFIPNEPVLVMSAGITFFVMLARAQAPVMPRAVWFALGSMIFGTALIPAVMYYVRDFPLTMSDMFGLIAPIQYALVVWLFASLPTNDGDRYKIVQFMLLCGSIVALIGLLEAVGVGPVRSLIMAFYPNEHLEDAAELGRVTSILGAWNSLGNFLMINLIVVLALHSYRPHPRWGMVNMLGNLVLCGGCLLASGSYASLVGLMLSLFIVKGFDRRGWKIILLFLMGMGVAGFFLQNLIIERLQYQYRGGGLVPETLAYRFQVWRDIYIPMIAANPWWGIAPTFAGRFTWAWAESQYFYLLVRSGMVSLVGHLAYVITLAVWAFQRFKTGTGMTHHLGIALFAVLTVLSIMGFTNEVFTSSGAVDYLWIIVGLIAAGYRLRAENNAPREAERGIERIA